MILGSFVKPILKRSRGRHFPRPLPPPDPRLMIYILFAFSQFKVVLADDGSGRGAALVAAVESRLHTAKK